MNSKQTAVEAMNGKIADLKELTQRKEEFLMQLKNRLAAVNAERVERDLAKEKLRNKLAIRMGLKPHTEVLRIQHDRNVGDR